MNSVSRIIWATLATVLVATPLVAVAQDAPKQVLFTNVNVFDGHAEELAME